MVMPPVSAPFDYLVNQIKRDLRKAANLCRDIEHQRHVGKDHEHKQLDALRKSLEEGPGFIDGTREIYEDIPGADSDGADGSFPQVFHFTAFDIPKFFHSQHLSDY